MQSLPSVSKGCLAPAMGHYMIGHLDIEDTNVYFGMSLFMFFLFLFLSLWVQLSHSTVSRDKPSVILLFGFSHA